MIALETGVKSPFSFLREINNCLYENHKKEARFVKTWKNKLLSVVLMICGVLTTLIEGDATVLLFISLLAIPMFFTKEIWVK